MVAKLFDNKNNSWVYIDRVSSAETSSASSGNYFFDFPKETDIGFTQYRGKYLALYHKTEVEYVDRVLFDIEKVETFPKVVGMCILTLEDGTEKKYAHDSYNVGFLMNESGKTIEKL